MKLYSFYRSTASFRVRIALNLKAVPYSIAPVNLLAEPGEQFSSAYRRLNPQSLLPTLVDDGVVLTQSTAICEYLEEKFPAPPLLPKATSQRARVRALVGALAADIHPLHALRVTRDLGARFGAQAAEKGEWSAHWMTEGLDSIEAILAGSSETGRYCQGDAITLADVFLIPQVFSAKAVGVPVDHLTHIAAITTRCLQHPAFIAALPANQATTMAV